MTPQTSNVHAADIDPASLSPTLRRALRLCATFTLLRRLNGFGRAPNGISLDTAQALIGRGLCRLSYDTRHPGLVPTGVGRQVLAVMDQRAAAKAQPRRVLQ